MALSSIPLGTTSGNWKTGGGTVANLGNTSGFVGVQVTGKPQVTGKVQVTAPPSYFQNAPNPQPQYSIGSSGPVINQVPGGINNGPSAQDIAAQQEAARKAEEEAKKTGLRSGISGLIEQALSVYDSLFGNVRGAARSQAELLNKRQGEETQSLTDQFNQEVPKIGKSYAARGLADSSYRQSAEYGAGQQFQNQLRDVATSTQAEQAKIGQALAEQEAQLNTGKTLLDMTRGRLGEMTDLQDLIDTQTEIQRKIAELQGQAQAGGTQEAYLSKFGELAPATSRLPQLQATLTNIIQGQAPSALKRAVAQQIIGSSGLPEEEKAQLNAQVTQLVG